MAANTGVSILNLPELLQYTSNSYIAISYTNPFSGQANTYKISITNLFSNSAVIQTISTPANGSALTVTGGSIFTDGNFLYVATSNNITKKVALTSF